MFGEKRSMIYEVQLVGSDKRKKISAVTPADAAAAFSREVDLPQSGWVVVEGEDRTITQYAVRNAATCELDKVAIQTPEASPVKIVTSPSALAISFVILAVLDFIVGGVGFIVGNTVLGMGGVSGGLMLLALAKVIACLHEGVQRLASIQEMLDSRKE
jgi:hypothetical protein